MIVEYFIKIVIPIVFSAVIAAFGWFAYEIQGAVIAGVLSLVVSAVWTSYSWFMASKDALKRKAAERRDLRKARAAIRSAGKRLVTAA